MNEIVAILSHADTQDKIDVLTKCIDEVKRQNYQIILSSHIEVPDDLKVKVDYFILDKENPLIFNREFPNFSHIHIWQNYPGYSQTYPLDYNHSYAVLKLIKNSLSIANINGFEKIHFVNYDYVLYDDFILKRHSTELQNVDLFSYYYDKFEESREHINTGLFSVIIEPFIKLLKTINSKEEFLEFGQAVFEKYFYYITISNGLKVNLENQETLLNTRNIMNSKSTFKHVIDDKIHVYLSKDAQDNFYIYINSTKGDRLSVYLSYQTKIFKWSPEPYVVNLLKIPNEVLNSGLSIRIPEHNYSDFYNIESNFANCEVKEMSLVRNINWNIDFDVSDESQQLDTEEVYIDSNIDYSKSFFELSNMHGTDKVTYHGYHFFYPLFMENLRDKEFNMLEIGWGSGASVKVWNDYFPKANIFVLDINMEYELGRQKIIKGDQSKEEDLLRITNEIKSAKFIIDDGSHNPEHQLNTFYFLFKNLLEPGGLYIIEDIELSYWNPESTLYGYKTGNVNILHNMIKYQEMINHEFTNVKNTLDISQITYGQNCIIIRKRTEEEKKYFDRIYRFSSVLDNVVNWG